MWTLPYFSNMALYFVFGKCSSKNSIHVNVLTNTIMHVMICYSSIPNMVSNASRIWFKIWHTRTKKIWKFQFNTDVFQIIPDYYLSYMTCATYNNKSFIFINIYYCHHAFLAAIQTPKSFLCCWPQYNKNRKRKEKESIHNKRPI